MANKIRVLYTIPNFDTAGSGKVLYDLAKGLNKDKFEVVIACKHNKGAFFKEVEKLDLPIHFIDSTVPLRPYYNLFFRVKPFRNFLETHKIDIVHSWHWSSDWSEVLATRLARAKFVYTKKAMSWGNVHWKIRSFLSDFIITVNTEMKAFFPHKKQQKLIPFGLDMDYYNPNMFSFENNTSIFKIVAVANLVAVKKIETLIKAIKTLDKPDVVLDVIGDDTTDYSANLKQLVKDLNLQKQVAFLGKQNDVRPFLSQANLYVIPSEKEGMPMALVEAMAMQVPVLGSNISGINYVLQEFQELLFTVNDSEELSNKILNFYNKNTVERESVGKQLRAYSQDHFSLTTFVKSHENLYSKLAGKQ